MHGSSDASGLRVRGLCGERGGKLLFESVDFDLVPGCMLAVLGANGSGKTTLLRILAGLTEAAAGSVEWNGIRVAGRSAEWRACIAYAGHRSGHKEELSADENLRLWCALEGLRRTPQEMLAALRRAGIAQRRELPLKRLSQGQKQRLTLARLELSCRILWLLDEPTASLDEEGRGLLRELLQAHLAHGGAAVVATHELLGVTAHLRLGLSAPAAARSPLREAAWRVGA